MFTGIVRGKLPITNIEERPGMKTFTIALSEHLIRGLKFGSSVSVSGVCLTVAKMGGNTISFDAMMETLKKTTLGTLAVGDEVNIERSAAYGDEVGGHPMSGHVHTAAEIVAVEQPANNVAMTFKVDPAWMKYIFSKGYIGLDGTSLTVVNADKEKNTFEVWFIPETLRATTFGDRKAGDMVNVEIEQQTLTIVDTVERIMAEKKE